MGSRWREPAFVADVKSRVSKDQFTRFQKMYHEPFFLLGGEEASESVEGTPSSSRRTAGSQDRVFRVSGSTASEYNVFVKPDGSFRCSCMDANVNCKKKNCVCKHVCFIFYRVFKFDRIGFFETHKLTADELARVAHFNSTEALTRPADTVFTASDIDSLCAGIGSVSIGTSTGSSTRLNKPDFTVIKRVPEIDDDCPVCYDALLKDDTTIAHGWPEESCMRIVGLLGCPSCGNGVHEVCVRRWLSSAPKKTCVFCRSDVWNLFAP